MNYITNSPIDYNKALVFSALFFCLKKQMATLIIIIDVLFGFSLTNLYLCNKIRNDNEYEEVTNRTIGSNAVCRL